MERNSKRDKLSRRSMRKLQSVLLSYCYYHQMYPCIILDYEQSFRPRASSRLAASALVSRTFFFWFPYSCVRVARSEKKETVRSLASSPLSESLLGRLSTRLELNLKWKLLTWIHYQLHWTILSDTFVFISVRAWSSQQYACVPHVMA